MMIASKYSITHTLIAYYRMNHVQLFGISRQLGSGNQLSLVRAPSLGLGSRRFESCIPDTSKLNPRQLKLGFIVIFDCQERLAIKGHQYSGSTAVSKTVGVSSILAFSVIWLMIKSPSVKIRKKRCTMSVSCYQ